MKEKQWYKVEYCILLSEDELPKDMFSDNKLLPVIIQSKEGIKILMDNFIISKIKNMKEEKKCECGCGKGEIIGSQGGCGICSPVLMPKTFQTGYDKFGKTSEELGERYNRLSMNIAGHYDISLPLEVFDFISKEIEKAYKKGKEEGIVEHCDEPNCPECNLVAYNKGRSQLLEEVEKMVESEKKKIDETFTNLEKILSNKSTKDTTEECVWLEADDIFLEYMLNKIK